MPLPAVLLVSAATSPVNSEPGTITVVAAPQKPLPANAKPSGSGKIDLPPDLKEKSILFGSGNITNHMSHYCDTARVSSTDAWNHALAEGCDVDWKDARQFLLAHDATVHVQITELPHFAKQLRAMPAGDRVTLVVTGGDPKQAVMFPAGLLADKRVVRVFRAIPPTDNVFGATPAEQQEFSEEKVELIRSNAAAVPASIGLLANASSNVTIDSTRTHRAAVAFATSRSCTALQSALERVWGAHESALLAEDPKGERLAHYYNNTGWQREVPGVGPYHYYHYYREGGYSEEFCEPYTIIYPDGRKQIKYQCEQRVVLAHF